MTNKVLTLIKTDQKIKDLYTVKAKLGNGCFGHVFQCVQNKTYRQSVLKIQQISPDTNKMTLQRQYILLRRLQHIKGIPKMYAFHQSLQLNFIELQRLDMDLERYVELSKNVTAREICEIGWQAIQVLRQVHEAGVVHRDLKPQNIMLDADRKVYIIDFGISSRFSGNGQNLKKNVSRNGQFIGTPRYASLAAHEGVAEIKPKDDIESLMYVLIYATTHKLPWITGRTSKSKVEEIGRYKKRYPKNTLCKGLPKCYLSTFQYLQTLKQDPSSNNPSPSLDYNRILTLFKLQTQIHDNTSSDQTLPQSGKTQISDATRHSSKKPSLENFLSVPQEESTFDCVKSDRVLVEWITKLYCDQEEEENLSVEEEVRNGEESLANKLVSLVPVQPKFKGVKSGTFM